MELLYAALLGISFLVLFAIGELLYHKVKLGVEWTRKIVHIGTGILTLLFPVFLQNHWFVLALCASFAIILLISLKFDALKSINAIERKSYGSLYYPLSVYCCFLFYQWYDTQQHNEIALLLFYIPILLLAICDPLATYFGSHFPLKKFTINNGTKSIGGALGFCFGAMIICLVSFFCFDIPFNILFVASILFISITATIAEFFGSSGSDNLLIPFVAGITTFVSFNYILGYAEN